MGNMVRELLAPAKRAMKSDPFVAVSPPSVILQFSECMTLGIWLTFWFGIWFSI